MNPFAEKHILDTKTEEPFVLVETKILRENYKNIEEKFCGSVYYTVNTDSNEKILKELSAMGCKFSCENRGEIEKVLEIGVHPRDILFSHPRKVPSHLKFSSQKKILSTTANSVQELCKIGMCSPTCDVILDVIGCKDTDFLDTFFNVARQVKITIAGVICEANDESFRSAKYAFDIGISYGFQMKKLHVRCSRVVDISELLRTYFWKYGKIILSRELGNSLLFPASTLFLNVIGNKLDEENKNCYYLNCRSNILDDFDINAEIGTSADTPLDRYSSEIFGNSLSTLGVPICQISVPRLFIGDWIFMKNFSQKNVEKIFAS